MGSNKPEKKMNKLKMKKRSREFIEKDEGAGNACTLEHDGKHSIAEKNEDNVTGADRKTYKLKKARKSKIKDKHPNETSIVVNEEPDAEDSLRIVKDKSKKARKSKIKDNHSNETSIVVNEEPDAEESLKRVKGKSKKSHKKKMDGHSTNKKIKPTKEVQEVAVENVYEISSVEEDDSKGLKKWIKEYHASRPGLKVLQVQIDNFITAHEEQEEQAKREREAKLAEEGWTVVVHRKGGKRTTDPDSGVAVGSVAEAAVRDKMSKKKSKDVGLDFYRFQRKEAHRSDIMKLQSKFEEDKKRIQQIRAARKFKPY